MSSGKITQVVGPVVDVAFAAEDKLPEINNALVVYKMMIPNKKSCLKWLWNLVMALYGPLPWNQRMD